jgi:limonene-1,2-epoxide hydrolase
MAARLDLDGTTTGPARGAGQLRLWQIGAVSAIAAAIAAVVTGFLDLEIVPHLIAVFVVTVVLGVAGIMIVRWLNRRH